MSETLERCQHGVILGNHCAACNSLKDNTLTFDPASPFGIYTPPPLSEWYCELFGVTGGYKIVLHPAKGGEPNWFWRWMQFWCFGNRWIKRSPET